MKEEIYYHGGPWGLREILPPSETGVKSSSDYGAAQVHSRFHVYITNNKMAAAMFASLAPGGRPTVYRIKPVGKLEADPDCDLPGLSFSCERALILGRSKLPRKTVARIHAELGL